MKFIALVSAHIFLHEGTNAIEIFSKVDNDANGTGIFEDIEDALLEQIEPNFSESEDYFFMAIVESNFESQQGFDPFGDACDIDHTVTEIKTLEDVRSPFNQTIDLNCEDEEKCLMYRVIKHFEVITDYNYHLSLNEGDLIHKVSDEKFRLDGTDHTFNVFEDFVEEIS